MVTTIHSYDALIPSPNRTTISITHPISTVTSRSRSAKKNDSSKGVRDGGKRKWKIVSSSKDDKFRGKHPAVKSCWGQ